MIAIRDGKSPEDAEMAASVAFQVAERKMFMKEEEKAAYWRDI